MANLSLKPQVAAFLDIVSMAGGADIRSRRSRSPLRARRPATRSGSCACATTPARSSSRCASATEPSTRRPSPDTVLEAGDVADRRRHDRGAAPARGAVRTGGAPLPAEAIARLEAALGEAAGTEVALERPGDAAHGDYATNVALRLAGVRRQPPRAIAEELAERAAALPDVDARRGRGPRLRQPLARAGLVRRRARRDPRAGDRYGAGSARAAASTCRSRWSPRTRPARSRSRSAERRLRRLRRAAARVRRPRRRARVLLQRRRLADGAVPRVGRRDPRGEQPPEDGYHGAYIAELAAVHGDPVPPMLERIEATLRPLPDPLRRVGARERARRPAAGVPAAAGHVRAGRGALGALVRLRRRGRPRAGPLGGPRADLPRRRCRLPRRQARPRFRPRDLRARRRPPRHAQLVRGGRADARPRPGAGRGAALPARAPRPGAARRRRCRSGAATSSSSTSSSTRSASTPRAGTSSRAAPTRRSRSTSTSRRRRSQKNPVYYVQYAHARIAGILRNAGDAAPSRRAARRARRRGARPDQAARRVPGASSPRRPLAAARTRSRPTRSGSPTTSTASTTSTRCSAPRRRPSASASAPPRSSVIARSLDLIGVEAPDRM